MPFSFPGSRHPSSFLLLLLVTRLLPSFKLFAAFICSASMLGQLRLAYVSSHRSSSEWTLNNLSSKMFDSNVKIFVVLLSLAAFGLFMGVYVLYVWLPMVHGKFLCQNVHTTITNKLFNFGLAELADHRSLANKMLYERAGTHSPYLAVLIIALTPPNDLNAWTSKFQNMIGLFVRFVCSHKIAELFIVAKEPWSSS